MTDEESRYLRLIERMERLEEGMHNTQKALLVMFAAMMKHHGKDVPNNINDQEFEQALNVLLAQKP